MTSESSSEWAADFKTSNKIFIAYKNFNNKKITAFNSNIFLYNKYFKILDEISLSCSEMKLFSFMQDKIIFKVDENYKWEMNFLKTDKIIYRLMKLFKSEMKIFSRVDMKLFQLDETFFKRRWKNINCGDKNLSRGDENLFQLDEIFFKWDENLKYEMKILNVIKLFTNEMNFFFKWDEVFKLEMKNFI